MVIPTDGDTWLFKKDPRIRRPLEDVGDETPSGVPVLAPEIVLLHKAGLDREQDRGDLAAIRDALGVPARRWLREGIETCWPGHPWLDLL